MIRITELTFPVSCRGKDFEDALRQKLGISALHPMTYTIVRRSVDARVHRGSARQKGPAQPHFVYTVDVDCANEEKVVKRAVKNRLHAQIIQVPAPYQLPDIRKKPDLPPVVVGMGPAGLFCALALAKKGLCPIVIERGQPVEQRRLDTKTFFTSQILDPESNVQFGEGGAGAFSDGKVNTLIKDPSHAGHMVMESPYTVEVVGIFSIGGHHVDKEACQESQSYTKHQPTDTKGSKLIAAAVEVNTLKVHIRNLRQFTDEHQPLTLTHKQFHNFVNGAEHDEAVQRNHNPIHNSFAFKLFY